MIRFRDGSYSEGAQFFYLCKSWKSETETLAMITQTFEEECMSRAWKVQTRRIREKARQMKNKVKSMHIIFFDIKGIVLNEFILAGQTINFAYYCGILRRLRENVRRLRIKLWREEN
jgi:hypothetical protein